MITFLFIITLLVFHSWILYPIFLYLFSKIMKIDTLEITNNSVAHLLTYSIVLPVYNASFKIKDKIKELQCLNYPNEKYEIIVVSDGSSDNTSEIVLNIGDNNIKFIELDKNQGKSAAQNVGVKNANNEIILFTDVDSELDSNFIFEINSYFLKKNVGCVGGNPMLKRIDGSISQSQGFYWKLEKFIRQKESDLGVLHSLPGWGFAIRKADFKKLDLETGDDMVLPLEMILEQKRNYYASSAFVYDEMPATLSGELKARQRITLRNYTALMKRKRILNPLDYKGASLSILSHKLLRWFTPFLLIFLFCLTLLSLCLSYSTLVGILFYSQLAFYCLGLIGYFLYFQKRNIFPCNIIFSFLLANYGFLLGLTNYYKNKKITSYTND